MPHPAPPPTPGSSSNIRGREGLSGPSLSLPPTAYQEAGGAGSNSSASPASEGGNGSDSSYRPVSPASGAMAHDTGKKQRGGGGSGGFGSVPGGVVTKDDFALPPPPTRSRKIIQMKPREQQVSGLDQQVSAANDGAGMEQQSTATTGKGKRKSNSGATTAAGRKIARKTAHSLIERRRRSKMNEEFGVLKDMIPACKGQEMHKLAILSASIEYLRYLEQCVADLQAQNTQAARPSPPTRPPTTVAQEDEEEDDDEEMADDNDDQPQPHQHTASSTAASTPLTTAQRNPSLISLPSLSQITSTSSVASPSIFSTGAGRHYSISSAASQGGYSPYFHSTQTSPAFGPQLSQFHGSGGSALGLGSPALKPLDSSLRQIAEGALLERASSGNGLGGNGRRREEDPDQEADAATALSMLNHDRRNWAGGQPTHGHEGRSGGGAGGMSVRDLLSG